MKYGDYEMSFKAYLLLKEYRLIDATEKLSNKLTKFIEKRRKPICERFSNMVKNGEIKAIK